MFMPKVGDSLEFGGHRYTFPKAPSGADMPLESEGGKAKVIRMQRADNGTYWAIKVFKHAYRSPAQEKAVKRLETVRTLPGLQAAEQRVIRPTDPIAVKEKDLQWSVLMPWVSGHTWGELLAQVKKGHSVYSRIESDALALKLLEVLVRLEREQVVHCDLSSGNVLLQINGTKKISSAELVDLEDMLIKGQMPTSFTSGSAGYALPGVDKTACTEGDRYAGTILIAEALAVGLPHAKDLVSVEGVFRNNREDSTAQARFNYVYNELLKSHPRFAVLLDQAWNATALRDCPSLAEVLASLSSTSLPIPTITAVPTLVIAPPSHKAPATPPNSSRFGRGETNVPSTTNANSGTTGTASSPGPRFGSRSINISAGNQSPPINSNQGVSVPPPANPPPRFNQAAATATTANPTPTAQNPVKPAPVSSQTSSTSPAWASVLAGIIFIGIAGIIAFALIGFIGSLFRGHSLAPSLLPRHHFAIEQSLLNVKLDGDTVYMRSLSTSEGGCLKNVEQGTVAAHGQEVYWPLDAHPATHSKEAIPIIDV